MLSHCCLPSDASSPSSFETRSFSPTDIILILLLIIMYIYHALINALSAHMIHINLNMIFYTHSKYERQWSPESCVQWFWRVVAITSSCAALWKCMQVTKGANRVQTQRMKDLGRIQYIQHLLLTNWPTTTKNYLKNTFQHCTNTARHKIWRWYLRLHWNIEIQHKWI